MSENGKGRGQEVDRHPVRDWFSGGDPDGPAKIRTWATGDDGRWRGYTHSMGKYVTWLMVIACILYPFTRGIGSILALIVAIFLMGGRALIERQVRRERLRPRRGQETVRAHPQPRVPAVHDPAR